MILSKEILTGKTDCHLESIDEENHLIHREAIDAFLRFKEKASNSGFEIAIISSFRDFSKQLSIWNEKATGKRPLYDAQGKVLDYSTLSSEQIMYAILRWSVLPGASRHHWGTDIDIFAKNLVPDGYKVKLIPQEVAAGGYLEKFNTWLVQNLPVEDFFRPYDQDRDGISPEWWHLSYGPTAEAYLKAFKLELLESAIKESEMELKSLVLMHLPEIYNRYIINISPFDKDSLTLAKQN